MSQPLGKKSAERIDGDMAIVTCGKGGPGKTDPEDKMADNGVAPEETSIKNVSENNLRKRQNDHHGKSEDQDGGLDPDKQLLQPGEELH
jgi:hypothetical protein